MSKSILYFYLHKKTILNDCFIKSLDTSSNLALTVFEIKINSRPKYIIYKNSSRFTLIFVEVDLMSMKNDPVKNIQVDD